MKKYYLVIELTTGAQPKVIGLYSSRRTAEIAAYRDASGWRNIVELTLKD